MRIKTAESKRGRVEIIPMIDVVFFLLVFSMLSSLAMATIGAPPVSVPQVSSGRKASQTRVFVTLTRDNGLYVNDSQVRMGELTGRLREKVEQNPEVTIIVNCDRANSWGEFRALMSAVYKADPRYVAVMTKSRSPAPQDGVEKR
jgi:biopolymer transport protein ExbD